MPEIGNVGCNSLDMESRGAFCKGIIVRSYQSRYSNLEQRRVLRGFCRDIILGICILIPRFLTKMLRDEGAMMMVASKRYLQKRS